MYKKLDDGTLVNIMETGIDEFAGKGFSKANMSDIAGKSGVSVGVIYKYFGGKDKFFLECLDHSLDLLDEVLQDAAKDAEDISSCIRKVVYALIRHSRLHSNYNAMYHEITSGGFRKDTADFAAEIEKRSADVYRRIIQSAQECGAVGNETDPGILAFFFDNLLMMMQFSYSCEYYKERMKIFCGEDIDNDEKIAESLISFMEAALKAGGGD